MKIDSIDVGCLRYIESTMERFWVNRDDCAIVSKTCSTSRIGMTMTRVQQTNQSIEYPRNIVSHRAKTHGRGGAAGVAPRDNVLQFMHVGRAARPVCTIE